MNDRLVAQRHLYRNACFEAWLAVGVWSAALMWTLGYCWLRGYSHPADAWLVQLGLATTQAEVLPLRLGLPNWTFWGVFVPWLLSSLVTMSLSFLLPDDELDK